MGCGAVNILVLYVPLEAAELQAAPSGKSGSTCLVYSSILNRLEMFYTGPTLHSMFVVDSAVGSCVFLINDSLFTM